MAAALRTRLAALLVLCLLLAGSTPALAEEDVPSRAFPVTEDFLARAESIEGLSCRYEDRFTASFGTAFDVVDAVADYSSEGSHYTIHIRALFSEDGKSVYLYVFHLIDFAEESFADVLLRVNDLNAGANGVKLYVDTADNSVTAELDLITREACAAELAADGVGYLVGFVEGVFAVLADYSIA